MQIIVFLFSKQAPDTSQSKQTIRKAGKNQRISKITWIKNVQKKIYVVEWDTGKRSVEDLSIEQCQRKETHKGAKEEFHCGEKDLWGKVERSKKLSRTGEMWKANKNEKKRGRKLMT